MCRYRQPGMFAAPQDPREEPAMERAAMKDHTQEVEKAATEVEERISALVVS